MKPTDLASLMTSSRSNDLEKFNAEAVKAMKGAELSNKIAKGYFQRRNRQQQADALPSWGTCALALENKKFTF